MVLLDKTEHARVFQLSVVCRGEFVEANLHLNILLILGCLRVNICCECNVGGFARSQIDWKLINFAISLFFLNLRQLEFILANEFFWNCITLDEIDTNSVVPDRKARHECVCTILILRNLAILNHIASQIRSLNYLTGWAHSDVGNLNSEFEMAVFELIVETLER